MGVFEESVRVWALGADHDKAPPADDPPIALYRYNGLGYRIGWLYDADNDGTAREEEVDPSHPADPWYWHVYNERWQMVGTWRAPEWDYDVLNDLSPKELFVNHAAGIDGLGGSSYIDEVILRDADETGGGGRTRPTGWMIVCITCRTGGRTW